MKAFFMNRIVIVALAAALGGLATFTATKEAQGWLSQRQSEIVNKTASNIVEVVIKNLNK